MVYGRPGDGLRNSCPGQALLSAMGRIEPEGLVLRLVIDSGTQGYIEIVIR